MPGAEAAGTLDGMLRLPATVYAEIVGHCLRGLPDEACGLLGGDRASGDVTRCYPTRNAAASAKLYRSTAGTTCGPIATPRPGALEIIGVFHSHTHTDAYPSPTDVARASPRLGPRLALRHRVAARHPSDGAVVPHPR